MLGNVRTNGTENASSTGRQATEHAAHPDDIVHSEEADEEDDESSQQQN